MKPRPNRTTPGGTVPDQGAHSEAPEGRCCFGRRRDLVRRWRSDERGEFIAYYLVMFTGILLTIGFTLDAGRYLAARRVMNDTAGQAAIAAGQHIDGIQVIQGGTGLGPDVQTAGQAYLAANGVTGTVTIVGDMVVVQTSGTFSPVMFAGFGERTVTGRATARPARGVTEAENQ